MASSKALAVQAHLYSGVDTNDLVASLTNLVLDLLASKGTDTSDANPFRDVLAQCNAVATANSAAAIRFLQDTLNSASDQRERR